MREHVTTYFVDGTPIPQGSMKSFGPGRMVHANSKLLKPWREWVAMHTRYSLAGFEPFDEPVYVGLIFWLPKPKTVKRWAPWTKPDLDKLTRAAIDGMADGGAFVDDSRVIALEASKLYATTLTSAGVTITIARESIDNEQA